MKDAAIQLLIEQSTGWLPKMQTGHACCAALRAAWIECTPMLTFDEIAQEKVKFTFENGLQSPEDKFATTRSVNEEPQMMRYQELGQRSAFHARVYRGGLDESMTIAVH